MPAIPPLPGSAHAAPQRTQERANEPIALPTPNQAIALVTWADQAEVFEWGLRFDRVALPLTIFATPPLAALIRESASPAVQVIEWDEASPAPTGGPRTAAWKAARLRQVLDQAPAAWHFLYWIDLGLSYRHLSFEYLYSDLLATTLGTVQAPVSFPVPGYPGHSLFGGPSDRLREAMSTSPHSPAGSDSALPGFEAWRGPQAAPDPNLYLAQNLREPVLHVIGDDHVYNCFTPNHLIGCRSHVLFRPYDELPPSAAPWPFDYQLSHHLGHTTMEWISATGRLEAITAPLGLKSGDGVVWVFGERDIRCQVVPKAQGLQCSVDEVVTQLARQFIQALVAYRHTHPGLQHLVFAPIPPLDVPIPDAKGSETVGDISLRTRARRLLAAHLLALCRREGLLYLDIADAFETPRGDLQWALSDHVCHINHGYQPSILSRAYARFTLAQHSLR